MAQILKDAAYMALPMNIKRGNPIPLDTTAVWYNKAELNEYAVSGATAYVGQVVTLIEDGKCEAYVISNEAGTLIKLASTDASGDLASDVATLQSQVAQLILSVGDISQLNTTDKSSLVAAINGLVAANIGYTGKIADKNVSTVKAALDTLAVGNYLDMTDDFTASGATSVEQWATMAAEGDSAEEPYRVKAGRYLVVFEDYPYYVTILKTFEYDPSRRYVEIVTITDDGFWYFDVYYTFEPGIPRYHLVEFSAEDRYLKLRGDNYLLPVYDDYNTGKVLQLTKSSENTTVPKWVNKNELFEYWTADATADFKNSGANLVYVWAGMKDAKDATKYRVPSGTYRVRDNNNIIHIEHIVTITDTVEEFNGQISRSRFVEVKRTDNYGCLFLSWYAFSAPGEVSQSFEFDGMERVFLMDGKYKEWLPEVTNADNGKCLRVVGDTWQLAPFTEIKSVAALPQNPDPNVLYLIREAEST